MSIPTFSFYAHKIVYDNPECISDGIKIYKNATIEINAKHISDQFLIHLIYHLGEGDIQVKVALTEVHR